MRPIKLKIQAFGPYIKPVELDFEKNLSGKQIFLIHGATGAGKTTILDAICFALYGTASGDERDGVMMRSKGISDKINTEVEFSFALGEKIYNVSRILSYNHNRKTNKNQISANIELDGEIIETQSTRVTNMVTELLGFNVKQFRQVVLLPQGEFKNFLSANSGERQPILDALFNAELYKRIEEILKEKTDAEQKIFDDLNRDKANLTAQLQGITIDDNLIDKIRADYAVSKKKSAELDKIFNETQEKLTNGKILAGKFAELKKRNESLETAQENLDEAEKIFSGAKIEYDLRESEQPRREELKSDVDKLAEIKKSLDELKIKQESIESAENKLKNADDVLKTVKKNAEKYERRLLELKTRRDELADAEKNLAKAENTLKRVEERENILRQISKLERELSMTLQKVSSAEKDFNAAKIELERLQKLQKDGSAALLAKNLKDGDKCPVCGSKIHPEVAFSDAIIPSDAEIDLSQAKVERCKKNFDKFKSSADIINGQLINQRENLKKYSDLPDVDTANKNYKDAQKAADELADCKKRIKSGEQYIEDNKSALKNAEDKQKSAANEQAKLLGEKQTIQKQIPEKYLKNQRQIDIDLANLQKTLRELENAWKIADKNFRDAGNKKSSCEGIFKSAQTAQNELSEKLKEKTPPNVDELENFTKIAQKNFNDALREEMSLKNNLDNLINLSAKISALDEKITVAEKNLRVWKRLSDAACGKIRGNKLSFARYYLGAMFEQVLTEANYRLEKMSDKRYNLRGKYVGDRADSKLGLNLEIFDDYTGETRPVATLSGGESFLASLSLALGLAAVVRNNLGGIKLDTIFIDEGFGSLDAETLNDAISTIIEQSGGRLVGIISHVEELKNQIPVRLEVIPNKTGSTAKFIV